MHDLDRSRVVGAALLCAAVGALTCGLPEPYWVDLGPVAVARVDTAGTLSWTVDPAALEYDPRVVICGGADAAGTVTPAVEVWAGVVWAPAAPMNRGRAGHTAVTLAGGTVLVAGGAPDCAPCAERYDPASDAWTETAEMSAGRTRHTATVLVDGRVLVAGGLDATGQMLASAEIYDATADTWLPVADMTWPRAHHTATLLGDGRVLVVGGETFASSALDDEGREGAELYDPQADAWTALTMLKPGRWDHTATAMANGLVLVAGGRTWRGRAAPLLREAELFDPMTDAWAPAERMHRARAGHVAALLPSGRVVVAGGTTNDFIGTSPFDHVEYYTGAGFERGPNMFRERSGAVAVSWGDASSGPWAPAGVVVVGGVSDDGPLASTEELLVPSPVSCY
jgi:hypothetical protein